MFVDHLSKHGDFSQNANKIVGWEKDKKPKTRGLKNG
jgi:hypothetical protein